MAIQTVPVAHADGFDQIIGKLYDSVLNPSNLIEALSLADKWIGSTLCHMFGWSVKSEQVVFSMMTKASEREAELKYATYYGGMDPRRRLVMTREQGKAFICSDYFDKRYVSGDEFYQDFLIPHGKRFVLGGSVCTIDSTRILFAFNHDVGQATFGDEERIAVDRLLPHIERTLRLIQHVDGLREGLLSGEQALTAANYGVITVNSKDDVIYVNPFGKQLIDTKDVLGLVLGKVRCIGNNATLINTALTRVRANRKPESLTVSMTSGANGEHVPLHVTLLPVNHYSSNPVRGDKGLIPNRLGGPDNEEAPTLTLDLLGRGDVMMLLTPVSSQRAPSVRQLTQLFGLSPAEAKLAVGLATGLSLDEYSVSTGVSVSTARNQLRSVLEKTAYRRQQDLVRELNRLPLV